MTIPSDPETSVCESLRKRYNTVSESVLKMFHSKKGHQEANKDQTGITGEKNEINGSDTKRQSRKQSSVIENNLYQSMDLIPTLNVHYVGYHRVPF